jgi:hypothetical protein
MNSIITTNTNRNLASADLNNLNGFSASMIRKELKTQNPDWTAKQLRQAVNERLSHEQPIACANVTEAMRQGWTIRKETMSKSGRHMHVTFQAPPKQSTRKISLSTLSVEDIVAELQRRGVAVA